jgi:hypothetical protein
VVPRDTELVLGFTEDIFSRGQPPTLSTFDIKTVKHFCTETLTAQTLSVVSDTNRDHSIRVSRTV